MMHQHKACAFVACRFALPALLPLITPDLHLTEQQGALLTAGYAVSTPLSASSLALLHLAIVPVVVSTFALTAW